MDEMCVLCQKKLEMNKIGDTLVVVEQGFRSERSALWWVG